MWRRARLLGLLAAAVSVAGLCACSSNIGQAAIVNGHRISESTVASYLNPKGPTAKALARVEANGGAFQARSEVLSELIRESLFAQAAARLPHGGPSNAKLNSLHDEVAQAQFGSQLAGTAFDKELDAQVAALGFRSNFTTLLVRVAELEDFYATTSKVQSSADLLKSLNKLGITITVSPRYGKWDGTQLALTEQPDVGRPAFVSFAPTAPAAAPVGG
jgi:hypothetical protein